MGTGSFPGVKCGWGVLLTTQHLLVSRSRKSRAIPLPTLWATSGLKRDHFTVLSLARVGSMFWKRSNLIQQSSWSRQRHYRWCNSASVDRILILTSFSSAVRVANLEADRALWWRGRYGHVTDTGPHIRRRDTWEHVASRRVVVGRGEWRRRPRQQGPRSDKMKMSSEKNYFLLSKIVKLLGQIKEIW